MPLKIVFFSQSGCLSCEITKILLEAKGLEFEERDMTTDEAARAELLENYHSDIAPTLVILTAKGPQVIQGFDPDRLDRILSAA